MTHARTAALALNGARVTADFRAALFAAAAREGLSVNEYVIRSAAEKLQRAGADFNGVFESGDLDRNQIAA